MGLENFLKTIGRNLAACRKSKAILHADAASRSGLSYRYYQTIESGKANLTLTTLFKLAKFYDIHPADLMRERIK